VKRVLLTGASGFIGNHAIAALAERGFEVHAVGRTAPDDARVTFHRVDLLDGEAAREVVRNVAATHFLHFAWHVEPGRFWDAPDNLDWAGATLLLLRAFAESGGRRAVLAGSCAEYEWGGERLVEGVTPCAPATLYGVAKNATRQIAEAYAATARLSLAWGRIFFLYGPGEKPGRLVSAAIAALRAGQAFPTTEGRQRRDFLHVADVAGGFAALLDSEVRGAVNIASGAAVPVRSILEEIAGVVGGAHLLQFGARPLAANEPPIIEASVARLFEEVGYSLKFDLGEGLRDTVARTRNRLA
jgi:nucleoside-diphosphate-sugar epimerase